MSDDKRPPLRFKCRGCRCSFGRAEAIERRGGGLGAAVLFCPCCDCGDLLMHRLYERGAGE
jgi:hypothetical protein